MPHAKIIRAATQTLIEHVEELTALDQAIGDGDHGLNMKRGALAIQAKLAEWEGRSLNETLKAMGMTCMSTIGGASGPVFGTLLVTLARELPAKPGPTEFSCALQAGMAALTALGKAEVGHKTLLDVLDPLQRTLAQVADLDEPAGFAQIRQCAIDAAQATAAMPAIKGRASFLGERALGHVDPGSRSLALIVASICESLSGSADKSTNRSNQST